MAQVSHICQRNQGRGAHWGPSAKSVSTAPTANQGCNMGLVGVIDQAQIGLPTLEPS